METTITAAMMLVQTSAMGWQICSPRIPRNLGSVRRAGIRKIPWRPAATMDARKP